MFKKITASLFALFVTAGCGYPQNDVFPDEAMPDTVPMYTIAECMPGEEFRRYVIQNFGHEPLLLGYGFVSLLAETGEQYYAEGVMFLTGNIDTGTWSVSVTFEDDMTRNLISGLDLQLMTYGPPGTDL